MPTWSPDRNARLRKARLIVLGDTSSYLPLAKPLAELFELEPDDVHMSKVV